MKKIMLSLAVIAIVAVGAIGATRAYFSDTAVMSGNTFTAGTMNLKIDQNIVGADQVWVDSFDTSSDDFKNSLGAYPGAYDAFMTQSGLNNLFPGMPARQQIIDIKNVGTVGGVATIKFDVTAWSSSVIADNLNFTVYYSNNSTSSTAGTFGNAIATGTLAQFNHHVYQLENIAAGAQGSVKIVWTVPASAGNDIQGAWATVGTTFGLTQTQ